VPGEEAIDVRVRTQPRGELLGDHVEPAGPEIGMVDRGQRLEDRPIQRARRSWATSTAACSLIWRMMTRCLRLERAAGVVLEKKDECRGAEHRRDRQHHGVRAPDAFDNLHRRRLARKLLCVASCVTSIAGESGDLESR
jgi:hypothetical protein